MAIGGVKPRRVTRDAAFSTGESPVAIPAQGQVVVPLQTLPPALTPPMTVPVEFAWVAMTFSR